MIKTISISLKTSGGYPFPITVGLHQGQHQVLTSRALIIEEIAR